MRSEIVYKQDVIDALKKAFSDGEDKVEVEENAYWHHKKVLETIESLASEEIVLCQECVDYDSEENWCYKHGYEPQEGDFCSYGEK